MSTVLHPAGPEPSQTYWVRRVAVVGVVVVVLAVAGALIANGTSSGSAVQAYPAPPPPAAAPPADAIPSPTATRSAPPKATTAARAEDSPSVTASANKSATAAPSPKPKPPACAPSTLRQTLTGPQRLKPKQRSTLTLSLINGSGATCTAAVAGSNFELRISSGSDRIWSTRDCARGVKPVSRTLEAEQALEWKLTWNGRRSLAGCKNRPEIPRPGTYYATAQFTGAEPVRLLMTIRG